MPVKEPESMQELIYFTNRSIGDKGQGRVRCWVYRQACGKCGKALMGKPVDEDGNIKIRAKEYVCPECGHSIEKRAYEETLNAEATYTCPECSKEGDGRILFRHKKIQGIDTLRFQCQHCNANIDVTKKMKSKGKAE